MMWVGQQEVGAASSPGDTVEEEPLSLLYPRSPMICLIQPCVFKDRLWADDSQMYSPVSDLPTKIQPDWCIQLPR